MCATSKDILQCNDSCGYECYIWITLRPNSIVTVAKQGTKP